MMRTRFPSAILGGFLALLIASGGCVRFEPRPLSPVETATRFEARSLADPALKQFLESNLRQSMPSWPLRSWDFEALTLVAFYFHPSLDVARAEWAVARAGVQTAGAKLNPTISLVPGGSLNAASGVTPWAPAVSFDLPIETAGKRDYRISTAQQLSEAARLNLATTAWQVRSKLRQSLITLAAATRRGELLHSQYLLHQEIARMLEYRLRVGAIARSEVTPERLANINAAAEYFDSQQHTAEARLAIADALGLPASSIDGIEFNRELPIPSHADAELASVEVRQQALVRRTDLLAALSEYAASQSALQLEIAKQYPDLHLGPGYQFDQGEHKWSLGLSLDLPLFDRNQGAIAEAQAKREEAAARFNVLQASVIAELDRALVSRAAAFERINRQTELTLAARTQVTAIEEMIRAGAADRLELLNAQLESNVVELSNLEAGVQLLQALADLEDAVQLPLESWTAFENRPSGTVP